MVFFAHFCLIIQHEKNHQKWPKTVIKWPKRSPKMVLKSWDKNGQNRPLCKYGDGVWQTTTCSFLVPRHKQRFFALSLHIKPFPWDSLLPHWKWGQQTFPHGRKRTRQHKLSGFSFAPPTTATNCFVPIFGVCCHFLRSFRHKYYTISSNNCIL